MSERVKRKGKGRRGEEKIRKGREIKMATHEKKETDKKRSGKEE